jgi:hypothetical protein
MTDTGSGMMAISGALLTGSAVAVRPADSDWALCAMMQLLIKKQDKKRKNLFIRWITVDTEFYKLPQFINKKINNHLAGFIWKS